MAFDFILMLTANDQTIPDAPARLEEALEGGVRHIGFKDIGLPVAELKGLAATIRGAGGRSYLEVVSLDEDRSSLRRGPRSTSTSIACSAARVRTP